MAKIYKNLWAGYPTWFIKTGANGQYATGIDICDTREIDGKWRIRLNGAMYYARDLKNDTEHFPIVGHIDIESMLIDAIQILEGDNKNV